MSRGDTERQSLRQADDPSLCRKDCRCGAKPARQISETCRAGLWRIIFGVAAHQIRNRVWQRLREFVAVQPSMEQFDEYPCFGLRRRTLLRVQNVWYRLAALLKLHRKARQTQLEREIVFKRFSNERSIGTKIKYQAVLDRPICHVTIGDTREPLDEIERELARFCKIFLFTAIRLRPGRRPCLICDKLNCTCHNECPKSVRHR